MSFASLRRSDLPARSKIVVRGLPPTLSESQFWKVVSSWVCMDVVEAQEPPHPARSSAMQRAPTVDYGEYFQGSLDERPNGIPTPSYAYVRFLDEKSMYTFFREFDGYEFHEGNARYQAQIEFAMNFRVVWPVSSGYRNSTLSEESVYKAYLTTANTYSTLVEEMRALKLQEDTASKKLADKNTTKESLVTLVSRSLKDTILDDVLMWQKESNAVPGPEEQKRVNEKAVQRAKAAPQRRIESDKVMSKKRPSKPQSFGKKANASAADVPPTPSKMKPGKGKAAQRRKKTTDDADNTNAQTTPCKPPADLPAQTEALSKTKLIPTRHNPPQKQAHNPDTTQKRPLGVSSPL